MKLSPHIRINDNKCREAVEFYQSCFGKGEVTIQTLGETPMAKDWPKPEDQNKVMHASYKVGDMEITLADIFMDKAIVGDQVSLMISCDSEEQLNEHFNKLSVGGEVFMKPEKQFWGAIFAMVTDKYGVEWNLNYAFEENLTK